MTEPCVRYERRDGVAILTLNRPEVHNALNEALRLDLATALHEDKAGDRRMAGEP